MRGHQSTRWSNLINPKDTVWHARSDDDRRVPRRRSCDHDTTRLAIRPSSADERRSPFLDLRPRHL